MEETFYKIGDYMLRVDIENKQPRDESIRRGDDISRLFNFRARQITTTERSWIYESRGREAGGAAALSTHSRTESFDDLPGDSEIPLMHAKLLSLGGNPPPLEDVMKTLGKQTALRSPKPQE
ncbi:MAG: hypothetical protein ACK4PK_05455 [Alphaproteobacteria bacterium]